MQICIEACSLSKYMSTDDQNLPMFYQSGLSLKIEEGRNKKVDGGLGVLLIVRLCLKCNNSLVIKALGGGQFPASHVLETTLTSGIEVQEDWHIRRATKCIRMNKILKNKDTNISDNSF